MTDELPPISALFFDDPGPHVVRAGFPSASARAVYTPARGQELRALLTTSITQLGAVSGEIRRRTPIPQPPPVPIDMLLYRGRAALDRALAVREEILAAGAPHDPGAVQELLDLVALASAD